MHVYVDDFHNYAAVMIFTALPWKALKEKMTKFY